MAFVGILFLYFFKKSRHMGGRLARSFSGKGSLHRIPQNWQRGESHRDGCRILDRNLHSGECFQQRGDPEICRFATFGVCPPQKGNFAVIIPENGAGKPWKIHRFSLIFLGVTDYILSMTQKILIASDHAGFQLKQALKDSFKDGGVEWIDLGTNSEESVDYPDYGAKLAKAIADGQAPFGVVVCGSGVGISIAANRNPAVRCVLCQDETTARLSRQHNDANVIAFGGRLIGVETAKACLNVFLTTPFEGGRHAKRVEKLSSC